MIATFSYHFLLVVIIASINNAVTSVDPEVKMNISEIIRYNGYPCEDHQVITKDGYILSVQRIPFGSKTRENQNKMTQPRPVALLQHGLLDSAHTWAINSPEQSLAFILADHGYDVWLANSRGNTYSNKHVNLNEKDPKFWEFSWDEMASFDLPACVDYALNISGNATKLAYIGHSQGAEIAFAQFSQDVSLRKKINSYVALAPAVFLGNVEAGLRILARFREDIETLLNLFGHGRVMSNSEIFKFLASTMCGKDGLPKICSEVIFLIAGHDIKNLNESRLPVYISHTPAGTSVMNVVHYAQSVDSGNFQMYDFGMEGNIKRYGTPNPPQFDVKPVGIPTAIFFGGNDTLADPKDISRLLDLVGSDVKFQKFISYYNHMDFVWGENASQIVYQDVLDFIKKYL